jgi:hypothetical protein
VLYQAILSISLKSLEEVSFAASFLGAVLAVRLIYGTGKGLGDDDIPPKNREKNLICRAGGSNREVISLKS